MINKSGIEKANGHPAYDMPEDNTGIRAETFDERLEVALEHVRWFRENGEGSLRSLVENIVDGMPNIERPDDYSPDGVTIWLSGVWEASVKQPEGNDGMGGT